MTREGSAFGRIKRQSSGPKSGVNNKGGDKMNHTPTPWSIAQYSTGAIMYKQLQTMTLEIAHIHSNRHDDDMGNNNAAFIIEACNSHDHLVVENARLREALEFVCQFYQDNFDVMPVAFQTVDNYARTALGEEER